MDEDNIIFCEDNPLNTNCLCETKNVQRINDTRNQRILCCGEIAIAEDPPRLPYYVMYDECTEAGWQPDERQSDIFEWWESVYDKYDKPNVNYECWYSSHFLVAVEYDNIRMPICVSSFEMESFYKEIGGCINNAVAYDISCGEIGDIYTICEGGEEFERDKVGTCTIQTYRYCGTCPPNAVCKRLEGGCIPSKISNLPPPPPPPPIVDSGITRSTATTILYVVVAIMTLIILGIFLWMKMN